MTTLLKTKLKNIGDALPEKPFRVTHDLGSHPLFQLSKLVELAGSMDRDRIEYNSGDLTPGQKAEETPGIDLSPKETVRQIETCHAWMVIKNVEHEPAYREVLEKCLYGMADDLGLPHSYFGDIQGFIFVSSANSTTPLHIDAEDNFLIQMRGEKFVHIFDDPDHEIVPPQAFELDPGKYRNLEYDEAYEKRGEVFTLNGGDGVRIPYFWPHWVRTGGEYTISMAVTWKTPAILRNNKVLWVNAMLRRFGMPQDLPGKLPALDTAKVFAYNAARGVLDPLRKSEGMRRLLRRALFGEKANYYYREDKAA